MQGYKALSRPEKARKTVVCSPVRGYFVLKKSILMVAKNAVKCYYTDKVVKKAV